jgi:hypothetical protein
MNGEGFTLRRPASQPGAPGGTRKPFNTKLHRFRPIRTVIAGLDPAIHPSEMAVLFKDGYVDQARV